MPRPRALPVAGTLLLALLQAPSPAEGQERRPTRGDRPDRPRVLEVGAHAGLDAVNDGIVLGLHARLPVDPWKRVELLPGASVEFLDRLTEYQVDADAAFMVDSRGAFYVGGGAAFRNTIFDVAEDEEGGIVGEREWRTGYNLILGLRSPPGRDGGLAGQLELRWISVAQFDLRVISLGVNYPLVVF